MTPDQKEALLRDLQHFDLSDDKWAAIYNLRAILQRLVELVQTEEVPSDD